MSKAIREMFFSLLVKHVTETRNPYSAVKFPSEQASHPFYVIKRHSKHHRPIMAVSVMLSNNSLLNL